MKVLFIAQSPSKLKHGYFGGAAAPLLLTPMSGGSVVIMGWVHEECS